MKNCLNCYFSRKAENKNYVGCAAMIFEYKDYTDDNILFNFYNRDEIATGWVNLNCKPNSEGGFGMITNGIPCFKPTDYCEHWRKKIDLHKLFCKT